MKKVFLWQEGKVRLLLLITSILLTAGVLAGCGSSPQTNSTGTDQGDSNGTKELVAVTQVTNWFAEPEHGGQYAALVKGFYKEAGLDMTIMPGGPQVSSTQIVSSGKALFGMTQADDLLLARKQGIPIVAIAALFQTNPQGLIYHTDSGIKDFPDLNGHPVYVATGATYWEYLKKKYQLTDVKEMKYTGSLVNFINDKTAVTQGYITSEPFTLSEKGVDVKMLLNADSGYNPYANVLFTTEKTIKEQPELVKAFVEASIKGWEYYKDHYEEINQFIQEKNPDISLEAMKYGAEKQMDFVYGGDAKEASVGIMSEERWNTLMDQMIEIKLLDQKEEVSKVFTNQFIPKK
ncbi:MAG: ABC transporter substrate-binding protein [Thermicanus sp.]|nr:ABC transporter substrate-binding protein [Thermicanus sp.]